MSGCYRATANVAVGSFSDLGARSCEVRFTPMSRPRQLNRFRPKSATSRLTHLSNLQNYSINSSAWASNGGGETERLGGLEVDRQFELYWGLNRKLAHFVTPQDAI